MVGGEPRKSEENLEAGAAVLEDGEGPAPARQWGEHSEVHWRGRHEGDPRVLRAAMLGCAIGERGVRRGHW